MFICAQVGRGSAGHADTIRTKKEPIWSSDLIKLTFFLESVIYFEIFRTSLAIKVKLSLNKPSFLYKM